MAFKGWPYDNLNILSEDLKANGVSLPLSENVEVLKQELEIDGAHKAPNRLAIQPMEGCDGDHENGAPAELTWRRYERFAQGGAGLIWFEAVAIVREGRANPRQLMITEDNLEDYKRMVAMIKEESMKKYGYAPLVIMQATHSGRYSKPEGTAAPMVAYRSPIFEKDKPLDPSRIVTDEYLKALEEKYGRAARLAQEAGFDGVDIKACHRYLMCETFSAYTRPGEYGGSFENRTRLFRNAIAAAKGAVTGDMMVTSRMNVYDGFEYPYGWGVKAGEGIRPDMEEPIRLVRQMHDEWGVPLIDITIGNPYFNPHVNRPYEQGAYVPPEHPFQGVQRACDCIGAVKAAVPEMKIISSAVSYLRQYSGNLAAGMVEQGKADMVGFGRMAFAYPDFAADLLAGRGMDSRKCCLACSKCTELMRSGSTPGCVIRDNAVYMPLYKEHVLNSDKDVRHMVSNV